MTLQWDPPENSDNASVDNYTMTVLPIPLSGGSTFTVTQRQIQLTLAYNQLYAIHLVTTNCIGTSVLPAMLNFTLGWLCHHSYNNHLYTHSVHTLVVRCNEPVPPKNGQFVSGSRRTEGSEVVFMCNDGFLPSGEISAICRPDMIWVPDPGTFQCSPGKS